MHIFTSYDMIHIAGFCHLSSVQENDVQCSISRVVVIKSSIVKIESCQLED